VNELSLFSGAGGGLLATKHLLGWKTIGYVEIDDYCQRIIQQRIIDGLLDRAPIFSDVKAFISEGYAEAYKGMVDVITGGFPCQPFSVAGKQKGEQDERNMWPETRDTIGIIRPRYIYLENVPNLLTHPYLWRILSNITEMGYDCRWGIISAADVGAPHLRKRWWIVANTSRKRWRRWNNGNEGGSDRALQTT
jgi:DNA (cytosine-5)-methyltransferase 1